jgi:pantoate--beta-alanine ligase
MQQIQASPELREIIKAWRLDGHSIALVPTMGNLHAGHMALVKAARETGGKVVVSLYVNPAQFGENEDLSTYPRTPDEDQRQLVDGGCDLLFAPSDETMYPHGHEDGVMIRMPSSLTDILEGAFRPGHFDGVTAAVARLFNHVNPDFAVFGEKDYQQLVVIRRMVLDLGYPVKIIGVPTVREPGGLALSSRNNYLDEDQHKLAALLNSVLKQSVEQIKNSGLSFAELETSAARILDEAGFRTDYVSIRRSDDLGEPDNDQDNSSEELRILAAAWCGGTRLIDNLIVR